MNIEPIYHYSTLNFRGVSVQFKCVEGVVSIHNLTYPERVITFQMDKGYAYTHYTKTFQWTIIEENDTLVRSLKHLKNDCLKLKDAMELIIIIKWIMKWVNRAQTNFIRKKLLTLSPLPKDITRIVQCYFI